MEHDGNSVLENDRNRLKRTRTTAGWGLVVNLVLSAGKVAGGIIGCSHALVADGIHSLSDLCTDVAVIVGAHYWTKPSDSSHPHGHARIETIVAGFLGMMLLLTGVFVLWKSVQSIMEPSTECPGWIAFFIAVVSIISKEILARWTLTMSRKLKSPALAANSWHHRSDVLSSIPVALAVLATRIDSNLIFLDGLGGVIVSLLILRMGVRVLKPALLQLSDTAAPEEVREELLRIAVSVDGVLDVHDLRTRFQGEGIQADMHIVVDSHLQMREAFIIVREVEKALYSCGPGVVDVLVRLEPVDPLPESGT